MSLNYGWRKVICIFAYEGSPILPLIPFGGESLTPFSYFRISLNLNGMLNQVKLTGTVKYVTTKDTGKRVSKEVKTEDGRTFWSHLLKVVTEHNGQGVQWITVSLNHSTEDPIQDGKTYDIVGYVRSYTSNGKADQQIKVTNFSLVTPEEKNRREMVMAEAASGSLTI